MLRRVESEDQLPRLKWSVCADDDARDDKYYRYTVGIHQRSVRMFSRKAFALAVLVIAVPFAGAQSAKSENNVPCPARTGIYARTATGWDGLQISQAQKEKLRGGPFTYNVIAVYDGASSGSTLTSSGVICASGVPLGSTFALAKAKASKHDREVTIGTRNINSTFTFVINKKQVVPFGSKQDDAGNYLLTFANLDPGQYLLFLSQGSSLTTTPVAFSFMVN
jgi:hypothetical protein